MRDYAIAFLIGLALVLVTGVMTHFVIGTFTEVTGFVGVFASVFYARRLCEKQRLKEPAHG